MNFGTIKDIYAKFLIDSYITESNDVRKQKSKYKSYIQNITENDILRSQFIVYKNIENGYFSSESTALEYLKENISIFNKFNKEDIINENEKLTAKLFINYKGYTLPDDNTPIGLQKTKEIHEAINNLIILEKKAENINIIHESSEILKKWLVTPKVINEEIKKPTVDAKKFLDIAVEKYNEKYVTLSEEEKKIIKTIMSTNSIEKELLLKDMVKESITLINNTLKLYGDSIDVKVRLLEAKDVVYNLEFNEKTYKEDISKVYNLKQSLI